MEKPLAKLLAKANKDNKTIIKNDIDKLIYSYKMIEEEFKSFFLKKNQIYIQRSKLKNLMYLH